LGVKVTDKQIETALRQTGAIYTAAAKKLKVTRECVGWRVRRSPHLKAVCEEVQEEGLDLAEAKLFSAISAGELRAVIYYLNCKGRGRGWGFNVGIQPAPVPSAAATEPTTQKEMALLNVMSVEELEAVQSRLRAGSAPLLIEGEMVKAPE
jgi:hypothetical protein